MRFSGTKPQLLVFTLDKSLTASSVKESVTSLDGVVDNVRGNVVANLPQAEAHLGHLVAAAQLDARGCHIVWLCTCLVRNWKGAAFYDQRERQRGISDRTRKFDRL